MLAEERQKLIMERLKENESIRISELCSIFNVTRETIRRDLYDLEAKGLVKKVHGGAIIDKANVEPPYVNREMSNVEEKEAITQLAASLVEDGDALFIDLGTTTLMLARHLKKKKGLTVITNSIPIAVELSDSPDIKVLLLGGELRSGELSISGPLTRSNIEEFHVDKTFIGVAGISLHSGITDFHMGEAEIRKLMLERGEVKIALADFSKFNVVALKHIAGVSELDVIVTDDKAPRDLVAEIGKQGVKVMVSERSSP